MESTLQQLKQFDGSDATKPVALKGRIFDVTTGKSFYGHGGSYCMFAGKEASRAFANMSKNDEMLSRLVCFMQNIPNLQNPISLLKNQSNNNELRIYSYKKEKKNCKSEI
ncbi:hypothetical protein MKX01_039395 [Papaver californicum]|nr:hypothetical protein MKX01_039395 [Papaver californicum]